MTPSNLRRGATSAVAAAGAIALVLGVAAPASATVDETTGAVTVDLLSITDFHGALAQAPNIAQQVAAIRAANPDTVFSASGDSIGGTTFESAIAKDAPTLNVLNQAGLQVSSVGNHEFDSGFPTLQQQLPSADFPYLAANVTGQSALQPFRVITLPSGVTVGYIGTVTESTPSVVDSSGIAGLTFENPVETTNRYADQLSDGDPANGEADIVVALTHEATTVVAGGINGNVDAVFAGHSHQQYPTVPGVTPANQIQYTTSGAPVVQAGSAGGALARIQLTYTPSSRAIQVTSAANLPVERYVWDPANPVAPGPQFDAGVAQTVREAFANAQTLGARPLGSIAEPFNAPSNFGTPNRADTPNGSDTPQHRGAESPLSNLLAEVYLERVNQLGLGADFGIMNPGGVRADLDPNEDGIVTFRESFNVAPFGNTIGTLDLTGAQVLTLLEQQFDPRPPRPMLALGLSTELRYLYDPAAPIGARIIEARLSGTPIDPGTTYRVASNTFLLGGQDGFTVLRDGVNLQETGITDAQAFESYLAANPNLPPTYEQQSIGVTVPTDLTRPIAPGEQVTVELSSLSFTSTEPRAESVSAFVVGSDLPLPATGTPTSGALDLASADELAVPAAEPGTVLATVTVDNTNVLDSNETGRATVTITVPEVTVDGRLRIAFVVTGARVAPIDAFLEFTVAADAQPPVAPAPTTPAPTAPPVAGSAGQGTLPATGTELAGPAVVLAGLLVALGLGLALRRRRSV